MRSANSYDEKEFYLNSLKRSLRLTEHSATISLASLLTKSIPGAELPQLVQLVVTIVAGTLLVAGSVAAHEATGRMDDIKKRKDRIQRIETKLRIIDQRFSVN